MKLSKLVQYLRDLLQDISTISGVPVHELKKSPIMFLKAFFKYVNFLSQLSREELFASITILVLSLVGTWEYIASVISTSFKATARAIILELKSLPGLLGEVKKIVEQVVFRDGTLPYTAREHVLNRIRSRAEGFSTMLMSIVTAISSMLMFYICALFMSFLPGASVNPSQLLMMTLVMILLMSFLLSAKSPVTDHAMPEIRKKMKILLITVMVGFLLGYLVFHDPAISLTLALAVLFIAMIVMLRKSSLLDKVDNATLWDRLFTHRLLWQTPTDNALELLLPDPETRSVYVRTWPYSALYELSKHVENIGELRISELLRDLVTTTFLSTKRAWGQTLAAAMIMFGFGLGMIALQAYMTMQYVASIAHIYITNVSSSQLPFTPTGLAWLLINGLDLSASWVPPVILIACFLLLRSVSSSSRAARIVLPLAIASLIVMLYVKLILIPRLIMYLA